MSSSLRELARCKVRFPGNCDTWRGIVSNLKLWGEVPEGFDVQRIGQISSVQTGPFGSQLHKEDYVDVGTPIVTVEHLGENFFTHQNLPRVSEQDVERLSKYKLRAGDIVFSRVGSVERRSLVRNSEDGWLFSGRCLRIRPNPEVVCSTYLSYFLGHPGVRDYIRAIAVGATMPSLNTKLLSDIPVYLPPLPEQRRVGELLGMLDEKIELNRQTARTLEELTQRLFKSWFVDFDPVRAKMAGRKPAHTPPEIADLFPDRLVDSPLGPIPEGWRLANLREIVDLNPKEPLKKGVEALYVEMAALPTAGMSIEGAFPREFKSGTRFRSGDTLMARITPCLENGKGALFLHEHGERPAWGSTEFIVLRPKDPVPELWPYVLMRDSGFREYAIQNMTGTSGRQRVSAKSVGEYMLPVPPSDVFRAFGDLVDGFAHRIERMRQESQTLTQLRNRLLPKLISGEIRVPEAQELAKESVS
ncbi:MAG: restriction endonuclease subunit S [Spiribacter salinus]|uniref:Restriction endonuclease subunit S n=1 Tax=Spiribacter salinus TaxID=1335746 RepID=A0A540VN30_9GAMM|nr:MAG: restriction endonuclease subunit S [Spiribacter salinus]